MSKRSRDISRSPSGNEIVSDLTGLSVNPDTLHVTKLVAYEMPAMSREKEVMQCSLPPHAGSVSFTSLEDFEIHYSKEHTNRCSECGRNLPSVQFLNLHIDENHNPLREALAATGEKTYACFALECEKKCSTPQKRRLHMIDKHNYPSVYNFKVINNGIDNARTMLQERRRRRVSVTNEQTLSYRARAASTSKTAVQDSGSVTEGEQCPDSRNRTARMKPHISNHGVPVHKKSRDEPPVALDQVNDLASAFGALQFVPRSVVSKRGKERP